MIFLLGVDIPALLAALEGFYDDSGEMGGFKMVVLTTYQFVLNHGFRAFQQISCNGKSSS